MDGLRTCSQLRRQRSQRISFPTELSSEWVLKLVGKGNVRMVRYSVAD